MLQVGLAGLDWTHDLQGPVFHGRQAVDGLKGIVRCGPSLSKLCLAQVDIVNSQHIINFISEEPFILFLQISRPRAWNVLHIHIVQSLDVLDLLERVWPCALDVMSVQLVAGPVMWVGKVRLPQQVGEGVLHAPLSLTESRRKVLVIGVKDVVLVVFRVVLRHLDEVFDVGARAV